MRNRNQRLRRWAVAALIAAAVAAPAAQATRPDDRAGIRGPGLSGTFTVQTVSAGFNWGDAAIGGGFVLAMALLATGAAVVSLRRRSSPRPAEEGA